MSTHDFATDIRLTPSERAIGQWIERRVRRGEELWHATDTIAAKVGCSKRTVQRALEKLRKLELLERIWDYKNRNRRRYVLLWRTRKRSSVRGHQRQSLSPTLSPTAGRVLEVSEDSISVDISALTVPPPRILSERNGDQEHPGQADELDAVQDRAEQVFGQSMHGRIEVLMRRCGRLDWVDAAIGKAQVKRLRGEEVGWGYVIRVVEGFMREGGPALAAPAQPASVDPRYRPLPRKAEVSAEHVEAMAAWRALSESEREARVAAMARRHPTKQRWRSVLESYCRLELMGDDADRCGDQREG